ncbi:hypothetical protein Sipo8835_37045 [Streptomyces ipomoeae]|nr:hypothetical protein [Streptomyces ipomoeae]MDX2698698.1 hypothetical protein [Streptomyces ipomoeae]MDX2842919.1 hypothetical protein [Streptomyces ipomoeae]TQE21994.1 hypothetical protein Sipo8835_37045 [Streptomyces ipomoeae]TQE34969.1 hypothetical protein Sipo7851_16755 [Streptomyces ipomoeae]
MFTPWRSAAGYAAIVTAGSAAVGGLMGSVWTVASGSMPKWGDMLLFPAYQAAFLPTVFLALTVTRRMRSALPRWQVIVTDSTIYTLTLLLAVFAVSVPYGLKDAVDMPFVVAGLSMLTLQLPSAYVLSAWASGRLTVAMRTPRLPRTTPGSAMRPEG